jgi:ribosome-associated protein
MTEASSESSADRLELAAGVFAPAATLRWQFARSSGPGGQNVNKVNTKAEVWIPVGMIIGLTERAVARLREMAGRRLTTGDELHISSDTERTQEGNRLAVLDRLGELLLKAKHEPKARRKSKPSRAAKQRRLDSKKRRSKTKAQRRGFE